VFVRPGAAGSVRRGIQEALAAHFAVTRADRTPNPNVGFGWSLRGEDGQLQGELPFSDIFNVVRDVSGVRKVGDGPADFLLNGKREGVPLSAHEFPRLGGVELRDGNTGALL
jgi:hypothetical protein